MSFSKMFSKIILLSFVFYTLIFVLNVHAQVLHGNGTTIVTDTKALQDAATEWGTTASGIAVAISGALAVTSLILPWKFFKETLGRASWIGLVSAIVLYITMSFFGNSIQKYLSSMNQCAMAIIGFPCN